jgi:hypothetical protein
MIDILMELIFIYTNFFFLDILKLYYFCWLYKIQVFEIKVETEYFYVSILFLKSILFFT